MLFLCYFRQLPSLHSIFTMEQVPSEQPQLSRFLSNQTDGGRVSARISAIGASEAACILRLSWRLVGSLIVLQTCIKRLKGAGQEVLWMPLSRVKDPCERASHF
jgi:hypothetical protein